MVYLDTCNICCPMVSDMRVTLEKLSNNHCLKTGRQPIQMGICIVFLLYLHVVIRDVIASQSSHRCSHPTLGSLAITN